MCPDADNGSDSASSHGTITTVCATQRAGWLEDFAECPLLVHLEVTNGAELG